MRYVHKVNHCTHYSFFFYRTLIKLAVSFKVVSHPLFANLQPWRFDKTLNPGLLTLLKIHRIHKIHSFKRLLSGNR